MTSTTFLRRSAAVLVSAGAGAALTLIPMGAAQAAVHGEFAAIGNAEADFNGSGGTCDLTSAPGSDEPQSSDVSFTHGTKHRSVDLDATFANSLDPSDTVRIRGHADSSLTLKRKHNDLTAFDLSVGGSVKITHSITGSQCSGEGSVAGVMGLAFTEHHKGWLTLTRTTKKPNSAVEFILINATTDKPVSEEIYEGGHSQEIVRALLKPGKYEVEESEVGVVAGEEGVFLKSARRTTKVAQTIHMSGVFAALKHH